MRSNQQAGKHPRRRVSPSVESLEGRALLSQLSLMQGADLQPNSHARTDFHVRIDRHADADVHRRTDTVGEGTRAGHGAAAERVGHDAALGETRRDGARQVPRASKEPVGHRHEVAQLLPVLHGAEVARAERGEGERRAHDERHVRLHGDQSRQDQQGPGRVRLGAGPQRQPAARPVHGPSQREVRRRWWSSGSTRRSRRRQRSWTSPAARRPTCPPARPASTATRSR